MKKYKPKDKYWYYRLAFKHACTDCGEPAVARRKRAPVTYLCPDCADKRGVRIRQAPNSNHPAAKIAKCSVSHDPSIIGKPF